MSIISADTVREALLCVYEPEELAECALADLLPGTSAIGDPLQRAQELRGALLDAVEMLRLPARAGRSASASRAYDCVRLRYLSGLDVDSVAQQLAVGRRQVYRDLQLAEDRIARLLASARAGPATMDAEDDPSAGTALSDEIRALSQRAETVELVEAVRGVLALVSPLAGSKGIALSLDAPPRPLAVLATGAILRQVLTLAVSAAIQGRAEQELGVSVEPQGRCGQVRVPLPAASKGDRSDLIEAAQGIAASQSWECRVLEHPEGRELALSVPLAKRHRLLIVEDNPGTQALYNRYLADSEWEPLSVPSPRLTVDLAAGKQVEAVLLDIMMSESDGWSVLQCLKLAPQTQHVPVVVCSVLNDPDLALALGASAYLVKPVSRSTLLRTLRQVCQATSPPVDEPGRPG